VDKGSFSAASRHLGVPLATAAARLVSSSSISGTRLLVRTTRKVALTEPGAAYMTSTRRSSMRLTRTSGSPLANSVPLVGS
jgi:DNA-binding transcriptional LysR family regulator